MKRLTLLSMVAMASCSSSPPAPVVVVAAPVDGGPVAVRGPVAEPAPPTLDVTLTSFMDLCARRDGKVVCAGGGLGPGKRLPAFDGAVSLAATVSYACAALADGRVLCRGDNERGQLGAGVRLEASEAPLAVSGLAGAKLVATGATHACAATAEGVRCWGGNDGGETGGETSYAPEARELTHATPVVGLGPVIDLALGRETSCAVTEARELRCWGRLVAQPSSGSRYRGHDGRPVSTVPVPVAGIARALDAAMVDDVACVATGEDVVCFGDTTFHTERRVEGVVRLGVPGAVKVAIARTHGCALDGEGRTFCWGARFSNPLSRPFERDDGGRSKVDGPERVLGVPTASDVYVGETAACVRTREGALVCWGRFPSLGDDVTLPGPTRVAVLDGASP